jgi:hypothetical protein
MSEALPTLNLSDTSRPSPPAHKISGCHPEPQAKDPEGLQPAHTSRPFLTAISILFALALLLTPHLHAQGCAQCLDSTRATPPSVQAAYRHAIYLLAGSASAIFLTGIFLLRRKS